MKEESGTTIIALKFKDGVIIAADRQTTAGFMVYHRKTQKIHQITENILFGGAGLVGDIRTLLNVLRANLKLKKLRSKNDVSVGEAANFLATLMNYYKWTPFFTEIILVGKDEKGYGIYSIDEAGGVEDFEDFTATGSGMIYALGVLETEYKKEMTLEEAKEVAKKAVYAATRRDLGSGGGIEIWTLTDQGINREIFEIKEAVEKQK
ncbi:proteasome subunit beta [Nanobdella aerobiophila]|uniref:proteasome endopeptidase complex n=1 Tax=Nanobdella aerobiophila TaxID=2586965 RepID=A0A915SF67_9ARCH|nr:proteasome subunit beta [Nanobdella aerobiophila]BBL45194.1 proteasome subunit beta [Nanobdella aerobiophila]